MFKTVTQCLNIDIEGKKLLEFTAHAGVCFKCFALIMKAASSKFSDPANHGVQKYLQLSQACFARAFCA